MKKIPIDSAILDSFSTAFVLDEDRCKSDAVQENNPDPKYIRVSLFSSDRTDERDSHLSKTVTNATLWRLKDLWHPTGEGVEDGEAMIDLLLLKIKNHVQQNGTIREIRFVGHGASGIMGSENSGGAYFFLGPFLDRLAELEKEIHIKVADRIVFDGCSTFSELSDSAIKHFSAYAKDHKVELVGSTSITSVFAFAGINMLSGRYVQFAPSGKIIRDKLDTQNNPFALMANDKSWTDYYIGHTPEEGAAIKQAHEAQQKEEMERAEKMQLRRINLSKYLPPF